MVCHQSHQSEASGIVYVRMNSLHHRKRLSVIVDGYLLSKKNDVVQVRL